MKNLNISLIQSDLQWEDKTANLAHFTEMMKKVGNDSDLILLPETFTTAFPVDPLIFAETLDGQSMLWLREMAKEKNAVVCGTILLKINDLYHNTAIWMRPDGTFELIHKRHPFSIGGENKSITAGDEKKIVVLNGWKIRPLVCYDIRFPVWARNTYDDGEYGFDLMFYLANFPDSRMIVWNGLLVARAIENQAYCIGVNRVGDDPHGLHYSGESQVVSPRGEVLAKIEPYKEGVVRCELDAESLLRFRTKFPLGPDWDK